MQYITFSIEADNLAAAKARLSRIETDVLNNFKVLGVTARPHERTGTLERAAWEFSTRRASRSASLGIGLYRPGLSTKDFIAPSSFRFWRRQDVSHGRKLGAVSFLEILAPELNDRMLSDILDLENGIIVNLHIRSIDQSEAIKTIKRKITDLDKMKIEEQKKGGTQRVRHGYNSVRPCHLWQRSKEPVAGFTEPQRANVSADVPCGKHGRHKTETG